MTNRNPLHEGTTLTRTPPDRTTNHRPTAADSIANFLYCFKDHVRNRQNRPDAAVMGRRTQEDEPMVTDGTAGVTKGTHNILAQHLKFERDRQRAVYAQGIFRSRTFQHLEDHKT